MTNLALPNVPPSLKPIAHYLKTAQEHENRDPVVTYWSRLNALQTGMKLDKSSKEAMAVLLPLMDWLEKEKKVLASNEAISNEIVASAHVENYAMKLFNWADGEDRASHFNKNVVKAFYTSGMLFDVLTVFGELTPENIHARKYAKWKAAYIHSCLKTGQTPIPGPASSGQEGVGEMEQPTSGLSSSQPETWQNPNEAYDPSVLEVPPSLLQPQIPPSDPIAPPRANPAPMPASYQPPSNSLGATPAVPFEEASASIAPQLSHDQVSKTKKYCKFAQSALDYDDKQSAIENLQKALRLLQTGQD